MAWTARRLTPRRLAPVGRAAVVTSALIASFILASVPAHERYAAAAEETPEHATTAAEMSLASTTGWTGWYRIDSTGYVCGQYAWSFPHSYNGFNNLDKFEKTYTKAWRKGTTSVDAITFEHEATWTALMADRKYYGPSPSVPLPRRGAANAFSLPINRYTIPFQSLVQHRVQLAQFGHIMYTVDHTSQPRCPSALPGEDTMSDTRVLYNRVEPGKGNWAVSY